MRTCYLPASVTAISAEKDRGKGGQGMTGARDCVRKSTTLLTRGDSRGKMTVDDIADTRIGEVRILILLHSTDQLP